MSSGGSKERPARLAPGDYVFLSFLTMGPMTAYDVKKFMTESVSNFWTAAHSQVYQQANRLSRDGFVRQQRASGARQKRPLSLTDKGRRAVLEWLRAPAGPGQVYSELLVKVFFAAQAGDLESTRTILEHDRDEAARRLAGYEDLMEELRAEPSMRYPAATLDYGIRFARTHVEWADDQIAAIDAELKRSGVRKRGRPRPT